MPVALEEIRAGTVLLSIVSLALLAWGLRLRGRVNRYRDEAADLRRRLHGLTRNVDETLGGMRAELARLDELAARLGALTGHCDMVLQQQQAKLEQVTCAFDQIKAGGEQLAEDALLVGSESRQSRRLALEGQAGLSATLMVFRSMSRPAGDPDVRLLAQQGRDQTYSANLAMAGLSAAASTLEERGTQIAQNCETQRRRVEALDDELAGIAQLAQTSAWRTRQARAASEEILKGATRLKASFGVAENVVPDNAGGGHVVVQNAHPSVPRPDELPGPLPGA